VRRLQRKEYAFDERLEVLQRAIDDAEEMKRRVGCQMKKLDRTLHKLSPLVDKLTERLSEQRP
jgi:ABC-type transporter Mla subunit MlaD